MRLALNYQHVVPKRGGAETYVVDLCHRLIRLGHSVDLYAETWAEDVLPSEVRRIHVPAPGGSRRARILAFGKNSEAALKEADHDCSVGFINTWHHDVLVPQGGVHGGSLEANSKRFPAGWRRSLYVLGKMANPRFWAYRAIESKQYDLARPTRFVAVSGMVKGHLERFHHVPKNRIHVVPNAIDFGRLAVSHPGATRCKLRNALGLAPDDLVGLFVGHNYWLKGLKPLLHALAERKRRRPDARTITLVVCGGGSVGPFQRTARRLGIDGSVRFLGFFEDVRACYWSCDFFISPTYYDPCSLVVFEALSCGLPVITTSCNGAGELIEDGRDGYVVTEPDAIGELCAALDHMADDLERARLSARAAVLGREQSMDHHVARLVKVFEEAAASKSRRGPHSARQGSSARKFIR